MNARRLLFLQFYFIAVVALMHITGIMLYLYWMFWWYDIIAHFLGGAWVALAVSWLFVLRSHIPKWGEVLACVLVISVAWEFFEFAIGTSTDPIFTRFLFDTTLDLFMDTLGGIAGFLLVKHVGNSSSEQKT